MSQFVSKYVVCPYYRRHNDNRICCEGTDETNTINLVFEDTRKQKEYGIIFCNDINGYRRCMVCHMLESKYPE